MNCTAAASWRRWASRTPTRTANHSGTTHARPGQPGPAHKAFPWRISRGGEAWELARGPEVIPGSPVLLDCSISVSEHLPEELPPCLEKPGRKEALRNHSAGHHCFSPFLPYIAALVSQAHRDPELGLCSTGWQLGTVLCSHFLHLAFLLFKTGFQYVLSLLPCSQKTNRQNQAWWRMPGIPALGRLRQKDYCEFKGSL